MNPKIKLTDFGVYVMVEDSHLSRWVEQERRLDHARHLLAKFRQYIPYGGTVLDVGAMIGDHTQTYAEFVGKNGNVYAFEANPDVAECCRLNMEKFPWVHVIASGLSDKREEVAITHGENVGAGFVDHSKQGNILLLPLNGFTSIIGRCDFMKVDIEGYEPRLLDGAKKFINKLSPVILMEVNEGALNRQGFTANDVYSRLSNLGYSWDVADGNFHTPQYDIIARKFKEST